ncbi:MAG: MBOAT family protein [Bacteroidetes bacterium]|nr:MBOAT family protein [Bacteroidota bacterium]
MLFNTLNFLLFLPVVIGMYYLIPNRSRWILLFVASCYFYMVFYPPYVLILFAVILIDYFCGLKMENAKGFRRKLFLILSVVGNIGILGYFKYSNFLATSWIDFSAFAHFKTSMHVSDILLPIGLSFHTFQSLSYTIEVYRGKQKAERHIGYFANYVLFFPQMVAGPIERYNRLGVQLRENHPYAYENIAAGFKMVLYGLFVKMCIADNMAPIVNAVYEHPEKFSQLSVITALIAFSLQIYADFYGYSTIALGAAKMMGINLMDNFKQPYFATSIRDFWKRWHISLSSWFRDYVFIPMGGSRVNLFRFIINIFFLFALSGFWHGANYTFIIWGALHGLAYLLEYGVMKISFIEKISQNGIVKFIHGVKTFLIVTFIWIFFRAENMTNAKQIIHAIIYSSKEKITPLLIQWWVLIPFLIFIAVEILIRKNRIDNWLGGKKVFLRWSFYFVMLMCIMLFSGIKSYPFIYFRF